MMTATRDSPHRRAASDFVQRIQEQYGDVVEQVFLYGSVARGEPRGLASDVDLLVVLNDTADERATERVRNLAYDVELEYGVVLSLVVTRNSEYQAGSPFFARVTEDAEALYG